MTPDHLATLQAAFDRLARPDVGRGETACPVQLGDALACWLLDAHRAAFDGRGVGPEPVAVAVAVLDWLGG